MDKVTRINAVIDTEDYKKLKVKLIMSDKSFTQWLKEQVKKEIETPSINNIF